MTTTSTLKPIRARALLFEDLGLEVSFIARDGDLNLFEQHVKPGEQVTGILTAFTFDKYGLEWSDRDDEMVVILGPVDGSRDPDNELPFAVRHGDEIVIKFVYDFGGRVVAT